MQKPLKFDIKLSFTSEMLQNNKHEIDVSSYLDNLLNKKINIHLKINLDKILQQTQKKKLILSQNNSLNNSEREIILNNSIEDNSYESIIELEKEVIPKLTSNLVNNKRIRLYKNTSNKKISKSNNATLVLDLDETLVYVLDEKNDNLSLPQIPFEYYVSDEEENTIEKRLKNSENETIEKAKNYLIIRPGFSNFIQQVKKYFDDIIIFTSSQYSYAEEIIKIIDKNKIISKIYSRKDCSFYNEIFYKDLNKIKKDLSKTIIIDNYPECYLLQHFNGLPIPSFIGDPKDNELLKLLPILEKLSKVKDVRNYIREIVSVDGENVLFNKANELLKIKKEESNKNNNIFKITKKKIVSPLNKIKLTNNTWKKSNLKISDLTEKSNNKTIEHDSEEKIVSNDFNDYFFIEKNMKHLSTIIPNKSNKMSIAKKINLNPSDTNNKKLKKKNLILEYSYNNRKLNYQTPLQTNPIMYNNDTNNENPYENLKTQETNINSEIIRRNNNSNDYKSQNILLNSARHFKSKSLFYNDENLFKNKISYQSLNNSRNNSNKSNLSFKNYTMVPFKSLNKNGEFL